MVDSIVSGEKAFISYIMAAEPSWEAIRSIILEMERVANGDGLYGD